MMRGGIEQLGRGRRSNQSRGHMVELHENLHVYGQAGEAVVSVGV